MPNRKLIAVGIVVGAPLIAYGGLEAVAAGAAASAGCSGSCADHFGRDLLIALAGLAVLLGCVIAAKTISR